MAYINLSNEIKLARANQIISGIGTSGYLNIYDAGGQLAAPGVYGAVNPDITMGPVLLVSMPLSAVAATTATFLQSASIVNPGNVPFQNYGNDAASVALTGTTGIGTRFQVSATTFYDPAYTQVYVSDLIGVISSGCYTSNPTDLNAEPVVCSCPASPNTALPTGCTLALNMGVQTIFNPIASATATNTGTATFARFTVADGQGVVDVDVGVAGSGCSLIVTSTAVYAGAPFAVVSAVINES